MKVDIIGGGPGGLYFAILAKKAWPAMRITVYERNRADDTFGFGVVFSDETLETFEKYDLESYRAITANFAYWDDIEIHFKGTVHRIGGNGFCGCARVTLLKLLHERARQLGVELKFQTEVDPAQLRDADLVVAADGINSRIRAQHADVFRPETDLRPNKFAWMGSTRPFDAFTFFFRETEHGIFIAHCYQYEPGQSTWVMETDPETFARAGLDKLDEAQSAKFLEGVFAKELAGHKLTVNRSLWRNFPTIRCEKWTHDNIVLIGDAKATAHFSIGSGTKLAMEDAIALFNAFKETGGRDVKRALAHYETERRLEVEKTQHSADVSLVWFEQVRRFWDMDPRRFAFGLMTRSKAITYDNLALRAPEFVSEIDKVVADDVRRQGFDVDVVKPAVPMFQPFRLRGMTLANRVVVSPMDQYSAVDGMPTDWHLVHLGSRATGGAGLVFTEMVCVSADARITLGCTGLYNDAQEAAYKRIADFVHGNSAAKFCLQLGHAGRKGATRLMWEGMDQPLAEGGWPVISASPIPYYPNSQVPREMTRADMDKVDRGLRAGGRARPARRLRHAGAALRARLSAGELHLAADQPAHRRIRRQLGKPPAFPAGGVPRAAQGLAGREADVGAHLGNRLGGGRPDRRRCRRVARAFAEAGADLIDVSTGQTTPDADPIYGRMFQTPFSDQIRNDAGIATMCVGAITSADQVNTIIAAGRADLVALARPHLVDPFFTMKAAAWYGATDIHCPPQYLPGRDQIFRNSVRDRADLTELKRKAKPKGHAAAGWKQAAE